MIRIKKEYLFGDYERPVYIPQKQNWLGFWVPFSYDESEPKSWIEWLHKKLCGPILYHTYEDAMKVIEDDRIKRRKRISSPEYFYITESRKDFRRSFNHENKNAPSGPPPLKFKKI